MAIMMIVWNIYGQHLGSNVWTVSLPSLHSHFYLECLLTYVLLFAISTYHQDNSMHAIIIAINGIMLLAPHHAIDAIH